MTNRTRSVGRMPRDVRTRERLREAQDAEARAVTAVCSAHAALDVVRGKQEDVIAAAAANVAKAEQALTAVQAELVEISGLERTAVLLGLQKAALRKALAGATGNAGGDQA